MSISPEKLADAMALRTISHAEKEKLPCIAMADLCRPGLQFAGYFDVFAFERPQIIGKTEMAYLDSLSEELLNERLKRYFSYDIPCIIIARSMQCPPELLRQAQKNGVPVYGSDEETSIFSAKAITFMSEALAPRQTCHGVLLDVFGVGLMITGESGVGKSECALELIKHGHQLVADDVVDISRVGRALFGESPEMVRDFMELRGVGIVDVKEIFGIGSIVRRMRIDLVIHLNSGARARITTGWATRKRPWISSAWSCRLSNCRCAPAAAWPRLWRLRRATGGSKRRDTTRWPSWTGDCKSIITAWRIEEETICCTWVWIWAERASKRAW